MYENNSKISHVLVCLLSFDAHKKKSREKYQCIARKGGVNCSSPPPFEHNPLYRIELFGTIQLCVIKCVGFTKIDAINFIFIHETRCKTGICEYGERGVYIAPSKSVAAYNF